MLDDFRNFQKLNPLKISRYMVGYYPCIYALAVVWLYNNDKSYISKFAG